jgi:hypothetical protein
MRKHIWTPRRLLGRQHPVSKAELRAIAAASTAPIIRLEPGKAHGLDRWIRPAGAAPKEGE